MHELPVPKIHSSGQAFIRWDGKWKYFGKYGTKQAEEKYQKWRQERMGLRSVEQKKCLLVDLVAEFEKHNPSANHADKLKVIRQLGPLAGHTCDEYTPLVYRKHRAMIASNGKRCARHINDLMRIVQRIFRWGVSVEMVELDVYSKLKTVDPLRANEVKHQSKKRRPANRQDVERTMEELNRIPRAIVQLLLFTGARPGEICSMRASEIDKHGPQKTWVYRPASHKTAHHGKRKFIAFGPVGQEILREFWPVKGEYFFPSAVIIDHYMPASLRQAVGHACARAKVPRWTPYSLRHLRLTELTTDKGLEVAASVAGHGETGTTKLYQHEPSSDDIRRAV